MKGHVTLVALLASLLFSFTIQADNEDDLALFKTDGFTNITQIGLLGSDLQQSSIGFFPAFHIIIGYQHRSSGFAGLGIGADLYEKHTFLPIFADVRIYLKRKRGTPFFVMNAGYSLVIDEGRSDLQWGGAVFGPGAGYRIFVSRKVNFQFSVNYKIQKNRRAAGDPVPGPEIHSLAINAGVSF